MIARVRPAGNDAVSLEISGERLELWLDAGPGTAGVYLLTRAERRAVPVEETAGGRARPAMLHLRKRLGGARLRALERITGERALLLRADDVTVSLRLWGASPALTIVADGAPLASLGAGPAAWPPPAPAAEREWTALDEARIAAATADPSPLRALLGACPGLGPQLAGALAERRITWGDLRSRLTGPRPTLVGPAAEANPAGLAASHDADLAPPGAVSLLPAEIPGLPGAVVRPASWREAAAAFLAARRRGRRFHTRQVTLFEELRREARRLDTLQARLAGDLEGLPRPAFLRRQGEALLAGAAIAAPGRAEIDLPDPHDPTQRLSVRVDPRLSLPANADRLFEKARRLERARRQVDARRAETLRALEAARAREAQALSARDLADLEAVAPASAPAREERGGSGTRRYLTQGGLSILVGRGARENHRLTFTVAAPEDFWLHARDVPGAHVILRDPEGRAGAEDLREAAELAAFFSGARGQAYVDVHVARRKHVRAARGGHGRVRVAHSDTLRAAPRDPEGRLRRRL